MKTYEELYSLYSKLAVAPQTEFAGEYVERISHDIAIGVSDNNTHCIYFVGGFVRLRWELRKHVKHESWEVSGTEQRLEATRLMLPEGADYRAVACLIVMEFCGRLDRQPDSSAEKVLAGIQDLILLFLRGQELSRAERIGLYGELYLVDKVLAEFLLVDKDLSDTDDLTFFWQGDRPGKRDIRLGGLTIEVKTTTKLERIHHFHGFRQLEPTANDEELLVASLVVNPLAEHGKTILDLIRTIENKIDQIANNPESSLEHFRKRIDAYGTIGKTIGKSITGTEIDNKDRALLQMKFDHRQPPLLYRIGDQNLKILRREHLQTRFIHMEEEGFECRIKLPDPIQGSPENPKGFESLKLIVEQWLPSSD